MAQRDIVNHVFARTSVKKTFPMYVGRVLNLIAALIIAIVPSVAFAKTNVPASAEEIRRTLAAYVKAHPKAMVALGTISGGESLTYFVRGTGEGSFPLDGRTLFEIGSVEKTFVTTLLAQMVQTGAVCLNDPIQKYLPPGIIAPTYKGIPITLASLAEHRSGLPSNPPNLSSKDLSEPYAGYTIGMLYSALDHYKLNRAPGARYEYSNFAYALLGQLLANRTHRSFAALIDERILLPLGMRDTVVAGTPVTKRRLAPAFTYGGEPQGAWELGALSPAGSMESNLHDMLVYLRANMNAPAGPLGRAMSFAQQSRVPEDNEDSLGLAWETNLQYRFVHKAGGTGGYSALIIVDHRKHYGMMFLANVANSAELGQLMLHLITPADVDAPTDWALIKKQPSLFSGDYPIPSNGPHFALSIFKYRGKLYVQTPQSSPEQLGELKGGRYSWNSVKAIITFRHEQRGRVTGLTVLQDGQITRAQKQR
jgi:D-alanyl-D-alanine-carboxypeptidase/D-alanyl-D-alanine-endopeptidase